MMSTPFSSCRFCLSTLIPPVRATTCTSRPFCLRRGSSGASLSVSGDDGKSGKVRTATVESACRTWRASSRVGHRMRAARRVGGNSSEASEKSDPDGDAARGVGVGACERM